MTIKKYTKPQKTEIMIKNKGRNIFRKIVLPIGDVICIFVCALFSYYVAAGKDFFSLPTLAWMGANVAVSLLAFTLLGLYSMVFVSANILDAVRIVVACLILLVFNLPVSLIWGIQYGIGAGTTLVFVILVFCAMVASRFCKRIYLALKRQFRSSKSNKKRVMIVGGGDAGIALIKEMMSSERMLYRPVCIADDDERLLGRRIYDVKVVCNTREISHVIDAYDVQEIFVAMPSVPKVVQKEIIHRCQECGVPVKVLPGIYQLANGQVNVSSLRHVEIQDLLGRQQVEVNLNEIMGYIENKIVLVTGGGGSIGSELCRQIALHNPKTLIVLDIYENNAYEIEQELKRKYPNLSLLTLIASVRDKGKMRDVFEKYRPQIVFNAAAHKHVPLMETSPNEAVKNNVFGTLNVAQIADEFKVETFVQISTDKAVNPTNIMGATKRICEMIIQTVGRHSKHTKFVAVRFGNVLGSNGSVLPLFKKQIEAGGPVTVTHKDIIRYFMTIPEAVALVLQAGAYAEGGQIFVLDMGEPVKIYDLAYNLIKLSGLEPNVDIEIQCTGLRPGEKLFEERLMKEEGLQKTPNGLINIGKPIPLDEEMLWRTLEELYKAAYEESEEMKEAVQRLVPTYKIDRRKSTAEFLKEQEKQEKQEEQPAI